MALKIIDTHPHCISPDTTRYPLAPLKGLRSSWSSAHTLTPDELIKAMDEAGVAKAALVHSSTTYGFNCDLVVDAVKAYPNRLTGVFSVNVEEPDAPAKMSEWKAKGLTGMRIFVTGTTISESWLDIGDKKLFPCYERATELGLPIALNIKPDLFPRLLIAAKQFPGVKFLVDHTANSNFNGGPPFAGAAPLRTLASQSNIYFKVTAHNITDKNKLGWDKPLDVMNFLISEFGTKRLMWGSNFPATPTPLANHVAISKAAFSGLSTADQEQIFSKTAESVYPALAG